MINAKFLRNLAMCETSNDFERFLKTKKGPERKVSFAQWPDFSSQSREWKMVVINDRDKPKAGNKIPPLINFDCLITLMRVYNKDLYTMFAQLLKNAKPGGTHYTDLLFPKVFELDTMIPRSLYEKKLDILQLILVARLHFSMKRKVQPFRRNERNLFHFSAQPFTREWAKEVGDAADDDILILDENTINALYVNSRNCGLAINQFKNDKTQRSSYWEDWDDEDGGSFLDNSD